jgi:hypothetical protein
VGVGVSEPASAQHWDILLSSCFSLSKVQTCRVAECTSCCLGQPPQQGVKGQVRGLIIAVGAQSVLQSVTGATFITPVSCTAAISGIMHNHMQGHKHLNVQSYCNEE